MAFKKVSFSQDFNSNINGLNALNNRFGGPIGFKGNLGSKQLERLAQAQYLMAKANEITPGTVEGMSAGPQSSDEQLRIAQNQAAMRAIYNPETVKKSPLEQLQEQVQMAQLQQQLQQTQPKQNFASGTPLKATAAPFVQNTYTPPIPGLSAVPSNAPPSSSGRRPSGSGKRSGGSSGSGSGPREWATTGTGGLPGLQNTGGAATGGALGGDGPLNLVKGVQEDYMKQPVVSGKTSYYLPEDAQTGRKQAVPTTGNFSESAVANSNKYQASAKPFRSPQSTGYANSTTYNAPKPSNTAIAGGLAVKEKKKSM